MASSAGLRTTHPVIRFMDEFGSLGSNPTPALMQQKVHRYLFECREENQVVVNLLLRDCPDYVKEMTRCSPRPDTIREHYANRFFAEARNVRYLAGVDHSALALLSYYAPYTMRESITPKQAYEELFESKEFRTNLPIHTQRLAEQAEAVAREVYDYLYDSRVRTCDLHIFNVVHNRLLTNKKLAKSFSRWMLYVLAEGIWTQLILAFQY